MKPQIARLSAILLLCFLHIHSHSQTPRTLAGVITTGKNEAVAGATVAVRTSTGELTATSDGEGRFKLNVPDEDLIVKISGKNIIPYERAFAARELTIELHF